MPKPPTLAKSNVQSESAGRDIPNACRGAVGSTASPERAAPNNARIEDTLRQQHDEVKDLIAIASQQLSMLIEHATRQTSLLKEVCDVQPVQVSKSDAEDKPCDVVRQQDVVLQELLQDFRTVDPKPSEQVASRAVEDTNGRVVGNEKKCNYGGRWSVREAGGLKHERKRIESVLSRRVEARDLDQDDEHVLEQALNQMDGPRRSFSITRPSSKQGAAARLSVAEELDSFRQNAAAFANSNAFELFFSGVILANTICMAMDMEYKGLRTGYDMGYPKSGNPPSWLGDALEAVHEAFLWIFVLELVLKMICLRKSFFIDTINGRRRLPGWNYLDALIVGFGLFDRFGNLDVGLDPMIIRFVRLLKLARFAKMFKMAGSLHNMNLILKSVAASRGALFWSMLLLFMIQCVIGMLVSQLVQSYLEDSRNPQQAREDVYRYYGTFSRTQFTMFEVTHVNYSAAARVLVDNVNEMWAWFFVTYRCSVAFAFLQVIRAVFIQRTLKVADKDRDLVLHTRKAAMKELHKSLGDIYGMLDASGQGTIYLNQFTELLQQESTKIWLAALDIDCSDPEGLFELLDLDGNGYISKREFTFGAAKLRGNCLQRDMYSMQALTERIEAKLDLLLPKDLRLKKHPSVVLSALA
jgi:hypothetical protein